MMDVISFKVFNVCYSFISLTQPFICLESNYHRDLPEFGPKSGGTVLTITGSFLDSGNMQLVTMGNATCALQRFVCLQIY